MTIRERVVAKGAWLRRGGLVGMERIPTVLCCVYNIWSVGENTD